MRIELFGGPLDGLQCIVLKPVKKYLTVPSREPCGKVVQWIYERGQDGRYRFFKRKDAPCSTG